MPLSGTAANANSLFSGQIPDKVKDMSINVRI